MFTSYAYVAIAVASALLVFLDACIRRERYRQNRDKLDSVVNVFDALGLGVFTVSGVQMAIDQYGMGNPFLLVLMGMTTGVGGGMLRDVLIDAMPKVLRKQDIRRRVHRRCDRVLSAAALRRRSDPVDDHYNGAYHRAAYSGDGVQVEYAAGKAMKEKYFDIVGSGYSVKCKLYCADANSIKNSLSPATASAAARRTRRQSAWRSVCSQLIRMRRC